MATNKRLQDCGPSLTNPSTSSTEPAEPSATTKRLRANKPRDETAAARLPLDLLLEILARSDVETILRSAAVSRTLRGAILDVDFRRRLALRAAANGGFNPALLRGVSYWLGVRDVGRPPRDARVVQTLPSSSEDRPLIRFDASLLCAPVASRDGLVLLCRHLDSHLDELSVCDSVTGHTTVLPPMAITRYHHYPHVLLAVDYDGSGRRSFEVLVADSNLKSQTYSSRHGKWSALIPAQVNFPLGQSWSPVGRTSSPPVVIGRSVYWLCCKLSNRNSKKLGIVALDVDAAQATAIEVPLGCLGRMTASENLRSLMLVVSSDGELGLVVAEVSAISMWTLSASSSSSSEARWSRRVVRPMPNWGAYGSIETVGFGERSGTVMLHMCMVGLVRLNLATGEAVVVLRRYVNDTRTNYISQVCLHEINLAALLRSMKPFIYLADDSD